MVNYNDNNPKKLTVWLPLLFAFVMVVGMLIGVRLQQSTYVGQSNNSIMNSLGATKQGRLEELIRYVESRYVDEVDREEMVDNAISELLKQLDPHSSYIPKSQLAEINDQLDGNFDGIGIEFMVLDDTIRVISPLSGGPSETAGILAGDKIIEIEDSIVAGVDIQVKDIVSKLRGKKGTEVEVGIIRGGDPEIIPFTIKRDEIPINSVDVAYMLDEQTGYIKVSRFSATTYKEFMKEVEEMVEEEDMKDLVIDLRQNPGGYLQEATNMLSQFFKERDKLLVYTEGRSVRRSEYESTGRQFFDIGKIAVLIDEGSASASEIVAGAIQDWDRGVIIGRRSFGKGLVQEQYNLKDGSALRLTVARYYTPSGRLIQKPYKGNASYDSDVYDRYDSGELFTQDSIFQSDTAKFYTSEGRVVYSGGGITPDIFIGLDSILLDDNYIRLRQFIPEFTYKQIDKQKITYDETSLDQFQKEFEVSNETYDEFLKYAENEGVELTAREWNKIKPSIGLLIKSRIARKLYNDEGFYSVLNKEDEAVREALRAFRRTNILAKE